MAFKRCPECSSNNFHVTKEGRTVCTACKHSLKGPPKFTNEELDDLWVAAHDRLQWLQKLEKEYDPFDPCRLGVAARVLTTHSILKKLESASERSPQGKAKVNDLSPLPAV